MKIEMRKVISIRPYDNNPRVNHHAIKAVADSIQAFGFRQPIVVDQHGVVLVGHLRLKAAISLGFEEVPVHEAAELSPAQAKAYRIADNKLGEMAQWDFDLLKLELSDLRGMDVDISLLGLSTSEFEKIFGAEFSGNRNLNDPDSVPAMPDSATTQPGDIWILGGHRLMCGDSAKPEDLDRLLDGAKVQLVNSDPPYNVRVEPRSNNAIAAGLSSFAQSNDVPAMHHQGFDLARGKSKAQATTEKLRPKDRPLLNDFVSDEAFDRLLNAWFGNIARVLEPGRSFYLWGGYANISNYPPALKRHELKFAQAIIWVKEHPVLTRKDFMGNHEWCFYGWREGASHYFNPEILNATDVWMVKKVNPQSMIHLTEKPVELANRAMTYSSRPGEKVLDLFGGSGSTLIAAEQCGRKAYLMELDPLYCDVIVKRYEQSTGRTAQRIGAEAQT